MRTPIFVQVLQWLLVLPVALLAGALCGGTAMIALKLPHLLVLLLLEIVHGISGGYPPSIQELADSLYWVIACGLGPTTAGLAFVVAGTWWMAPTRSSAVKVVAVTWCGVVIASPLVAPVTALLMGEGKGLLDPNAYTLPWWGWMFASLGAVLGVLFVTSEHAK